MSDSVLRAFFIGRAAAEALYEQASQLLGEALSTAGKWDAEQRERIRTLSQTVVERAEREEQQLRQGEAPVPTPSGRPEDLQAALDELRAEMARLRATLKTYRLS